MTPAFYLGDMLDSESSVKDQLMERGMTGETVDMIESLAHTDYCCQKMEGINCARPVIDYGSSEILFFAMYLPYLTDKNEICYRDTIISNCPFCGKPLHRKIHPHTQKKMEDF